MKIKTKGALAVAQINFRHARLAYYLTAFFLFVGVLNLFQTLTGITGNLYVEMSNYLYGLAVFAAIFVPTLNYKRMMHLNGRKSDYYTGTLLTYGIIAAAVSLVNILFFVLTRALFAGKLNIKSLVVVFGWWENGVVLAFLQQFAFLLLVAVFVHTLTSMQTFWYGWVVDVLLVAVLGFFIPSASLRSYLVGFFNTIIFHDNPLVQILSCLILVAVLYGISWLVLRRKKV